MKTTIIVLCFALPHSILGSIYGPRKDGNIRKLDFIDNYDINNNNEHFPSFETKKLKVLNEFGETQYIQPTINENVYKNQHLTKKNDDRKQTQTVPVNSQEQNQRKTSSEEKMPMKTMKDESRSQESLRADSSSHENKSTEQKKKIVLKSEVGVVKSDKSLEKHTTEHKKDSKSEEDQQFTTSEKTEEEKNKVLAGNEFLTHFKQMLHLLVDEKVKNVKESTVQQKKQQDRTSAYKNDKYQNTKSMKYHSKMQDNKSQEHIEEALIPEDRSSAHSEQYQSESRQSHSGHRSNKNKYSTRYGAETMKHQAYSNEDSEKQNLKPRNVAPNHSEQVSSEEKTMERKYTQAKYDESKQDSSTIALKNYESLPNLVQRDEQLSPQYPRAMSPVFWTIGGDFPYFQKQKPLYSMDISGSPVIMPRIINAIEEPKKGVEAINEVNNEASNTFPSISVKESIMFSENLYKATEENKDINKNATELLKAHNYPVEEHTVKTDDGYLLTIFRIPLYRRVKENAPVVFLMHGLLGSADDWLLMGPSKSLAYLLAEQGYDVWLGNTRGNKYSRRHVSKHPSQTDFWQYSNDEIALQDLPAMIDYVLEMSKQRKMFYVGFSQGNANLFALASTRPEYNEKILTVHAISPMAYMANAKSPLVKVITPNKTNYYKNLVQFQDSLNAGEFEMSEPWLDVAGGGLCFEKIRDEAVCRNVNFVMSGVNLDQLEPETAAMIIGHLPAGASTRQMMHVGQQAASEYFRMYDHGPEMNEMVYGSTQPLMYDMSKVSAPVALYFSEQDWLASPIDVERLEKDLPKVILSHKVTENFFNMDFQFGKQAPELVYTKLVDTIKNTPIGVIEF